MSNSPTTVSRSNRTESSAAEPPFSFETTFSKLLVAVRPLAYRITLSPDIGKLASPRPQDEVAFDGKVTVDCEIIRPTNTITLNAEKDLAFGPEAVSIDGVKAKEVQRAERSATLIFPKAFGAGRHQLEIAYSGKFTATPQGLYYSDYKRIGDGTTARLIMTQFEATDARRMFPCWDEPLFKARFAITVELPSKFVAVSNMPGRSEQSANGQSKRWTFNSTPKMSSYLVVLVAGELERLDDAAISERVGADIGVIAAAGRQDQGKYALKVMEQVLPFFNNYFGVNYPLPKLDLIAIPDFAFTAMENWGGITYIDNALLFDESVSAHKTRENVFETIAHEVAHQWSGNLVTMAWWDNLWLNEGFASWMQKKASDKLNKSWKIMLRSHSDKEGAMALDALDTAKEIHHDILDDSEADSAFDAITYRKGAALIRMIEDYVGEEGFRNGMRLYMRSHQYSSATTTDLWNALQEESGKDDVSAIASGFVSQPGIPLIRVDQTFKDGKQVVMLKQEPYSIHGPSNADRHWKVPVRVARPGEQESQLRVVGDTPERLEFNGSGAVKVNIGDVGYFRALYDPAALGEFAKNFGRLGAADQLNLVDDTWAMVQSGFTEPEAYLEFTKQLGNIDDFAVWASVVGTLRDIDDLERGSSGRGKFRDYARKLIQPMFLKLGWDPASDEEEKAPLNSLLRATVMTALGRFGDADVITGARQRFDRGPDTLHKEVRQPIATVVGYAADETAFEKLRALGKNAPTTEIRLLYYYALAGAGTAALIQRMIEIALAPDELPRGRVDRFLGAAAATSDDPETVWQKVLQRREDLFRKLSAAQQQRLLPEVAVASSSASVADELKAATGPSPGAIYEAERAIEQIRFKAAFKERLVRKVDAWIAKQP